MKQSLNEVKRMQQLAGIINEYSWDDPKYIAPGEASKWDEGEYIEIASKLTPEQQKLVLKKIKKDVLIDCKFEIVDNKLKLFIPFGGDYENVKDVLDSLNIKIK